jgi:hypothetical protein
MITIVRDRKQRGEHHVFIGMLDPKIRVYLKSKNKKKNKKNRNK